MSAYAVLVTDRQLLPILSGNRLRILGIIRALRELGWKVAIVAPHNVAPANQLRQLVDDMLLVRAKGFAGGEIDNFDPSPFRRALNRLAARVRPAVAIAEYTWMAPALSDMPRGVHRWIDCHDVLHERTERFGAAGLDPWTFCTWKQEHRRLAYGDVIITTQEREASLLCDLLPDKSIACALTPIDLPAGFSHSPGRGNIVLTVGANHPGNYAVGQFARDAWPRVLARAPEAMLHVVGGIGAVLPAFPGGKVFGLVADLQPHYASAAVVVCPVTVGTGVKTKMLEALRFGKAVVVTTAAAEGMPVSNEQAWITVESLSACADAVADLLTNPSARARLESAAFAFGEQHIAAESFRERIGSLLPDGAAPDWPMARPGHADLPASTSPHPRRTVTVIVPHAGSPRQLRACLSSVLDQNYPSMFIKIVVVVRASRDDRCAAIAAEFPEVSLLREANPGPAAARNRGATIANGELIAFLDSDCRPAPDWLENAVAIFDQDADCVVACGIRPQMRQFGAAGVLHYEAAVLPDRQHAPGYSAAAIVMPHAVWRRVGEFDQDFTEAACEGREWLLRATAHGTRVVCAPTAQVEHPVCATWRGLRAKSRRLMRGELQLAVKCSGRSVPDKRTIVQDCTNRLRRELSMAWHDPRIPWHVRGDVAVAAGLVWYWRLAECRRPPPTRRPPLESALTACFPALSIGSLSVIVPCQGWSDALAHCLRSVQAQAIDLPIEVIVVVNLPHSHAAEIVWPDIRVVYEPIRGAAAARNTGVRLSTGDVLAFIDSDCVASKTWLECGLSAMRNCAALSIVAGAIARSGARRNWVSLYDSVTYLRQEDYVRGPGACATANVLVHRSVFEFVGPFDETFTEAAFEDWDWSLRARRAGVPIVYDPQVIVDHPCMSRFHEVRRKAERLARGELLMQRKLGQAPPRFDLLPTLTREIKKAWKHSRLVGADRVRVMCVGITAGFWAWLAFRQRHRSEGRCGGGDTGRNR